MKILHIIPTYIPASMSSGPIGPIHALNKELVNLGHEVTVYTSNMDGKNILNVPIQKEISIDGVKVVYFPITFLPWRYSRTLHKALRKTCGYFDIVHISSLFLSFSTLGAWYARKCKKPYVISPHGMLMKIPLQSKYWKKKFYIFLVEMKNITKASLIHLTTALEKNEYLTKVSSSLGKEIVIPLPIEKKVADAQASAFRKKFNISTDKKIILFLGRLNWIKGFDTLIPAFSKVVAKEKNTLLVVVGPDYGYVKQLQELIDTYNVKEYVLLTGVLEGGDKVGAYKESDIFVLPSYSENFSIATSEAMEAGLPVVVTNGVGIADSIKLYGAGIVVEKNPEVLAEAIIEILGNYKLAEKMGEAGQKLVINEFTPKNVAIRIEKEYKRVINDY